MASEYYYGLLPNELTAIVSKLGGQSGALKFLHDQDWQDASVPYIKLASERVLLCLKATDGKEKIIEAGEFFGVIDPAFDQPAFRVDGDPTDPQCIQVREIVGQEGCLMHIITHLGIDKDLLCLTQGQIVDFVRHCYMWIMQHDGVTQFLFKADKEIVVVVISWTAEMGKLEVHLFGFLEVCHFKTPLRFVTPKITK